MSKIHVGGGVAAEAKIAGPQDAVAGPFMVADVACGAPRPDGNGTYVAWEDKFHNMVVNQGRNHILNVMFAADRASTLGPFVFLHSVNAAPASGSVWSQISASRLTSLVYAGTSTNFFPLPFPSTYKGASDTGVNSLSTTFSLVNSGAAQTVSGMGMMFYTAAAMATNAASVDIRLYNYGTFTGGSQQINSLNTISITVTASFNSA